MERPAAESGDLVRTEAASAEMAQVDAILDAYPKTPASLIAVLQDIQARFYYLPREALERVARALNVPLSQVYSVATFYTAFTLKPRGRHHVCVCTGTACHVRGATRILEQMERALGIEAGDTAADGRFSLEEVHCMGCCSLAPAVRIGEQTYGNVRLDEISKLLKKYE